MPFNVALAAGFPDKYGYIMIMRQDNQWNLAHKSFLEPVSEVWFDAVRSFSDGYAAVQKDNKWNFLSEKGSLLSESWFDSVKDFSNGFGVVERKNGTFGYIDTQGIVQGHHHFAGKFLYSRALISSGKWFYYINRNLKKIKGPFEYGSNVLMGRMAIVRDKHGQRVIAL